jgi:hypothetical protein
MGKKFCLIDIESCISSMHRLQRTFINRSYFNLLLVDQSKSALHFEKYTAICDTKTSVVFLEAYETFSFVRSSGDFVWNLYCLMQKMFQSKQSYCCGLHSIAMSKKVACIKVSQTSSHERQRRLLIQRRFTCVLTLCSFSWMLEKTH